MGSTANSLTKTQDQKESGCCCGSPTDAPKSVAAQTRKTAAAVVQDTEVEEIAGDQPKGCCCAH